MVRIALAAAVFGAMLAGVVTPAAAQDLCEPGAFGEGGNYTLRDGNDRRVTSAWVEFQCGDQLSDGTFIPTGYRVTLEGECGGAPCNYPIVVAMPMAQENLYNVRFAFEGKNMTLRLRPMARQEGVVIVMNARSPERGARAERARYRLTKTKPQPNQ